MRKVIDVSNRLWHLDLAELRRQREREEGQDEHGRQSSSAMPEAHVGSIDERIHEASGEFPQQTYDVLRLVAEIGVA